MFVHNPHDLGSIHGASPTDRDDAIWLECLHSSSPFLGAYQGRIWGNVEERRVLDTHLVQFVRDGARVTVIEQESIRHHEDTFLADHVFQFIQRNR